MFKSIILLCTIAGVLGAKVPGYWLSQSEGRIVGGTLTTIEKYPYMVSLRFLGSFICGGSILNKRYVVSAGHCAIVNKARYFTVHAGSSFSNKEGTEFPVDRITVHEDYNPYILTNDISLFRVATSFEFGTTMQFIPLPNFAPVNGSSAEVIGYGVTESNGENATNQLRVAVVFTIDKSNCESDMYNYEDSIYEGMFCAGNPGKDSCQGDSGGPLVVANTLAGIVSWGYKCAQAGYPGVYTNVYEFKPWILAKIGNQTVL